MRGILIDVMRLLYLRTTGQVTTGIDRVTLEYVRHYADRARAVLSLGPLAAASSRADSARLFRKLLDGGNGLRPLAAELSAKACFWNWLMPGTGDSILINTSAQWLNYRHYAAHLRWLGARPVYFVHDLIPIAYPEYVSRASKHNHLTMIRNSLTEARGIIVNSRDTEAALARCAGELGLKCPPTVVAPLAPAIVGSQAQGAAPIDQPYFVCVGWIAPRKNHWLLLHLWRALVGRHGEAAPRLFVIGQRGGERGNSVDMLDRCEALKGFVFEDNACSDEKLAAIVRHARALLMPSFCEGYGLPVAEALAAGVPVIASDLPVFREVAGEVPEYVDPLDGPRWTELILDYARPQSARRAAQLERIANFHPSTWAQHFAIVDEFLARLSENSAGKESR